MFQFYEFKKKTDKQINKKKSCRSIYILRLIQNQWRTPTFYQEKSLSYWVTTHEKTHFNKRMFKSWQLEKPTEYALENKNITMSLSFYMHNFKCQLIVNITEFQISVQQSFISFFPFSGFRGSFFSWTSLHFRTSAQNWTNRAEEGICAISTIFLTL